MALTAEEQRMKDYIASRYQGGGADPGMNTFNPDFQDAVAGDMAGRQALAAQGTYDPTGMDLTGYARTAFGVDLDQAPTDVRQQLAQQYMAAIQNRDAFGWRGDALPSLVNQYMEAVRSGDRAAAVVAQTKASRAGLSGGDLQSVTSSLDPKFSSNVYTKYYDPSTRQDAYGPSVDLSQAFQSGSSGWTVAKTYAERYGMTPEQVADALGVDVNAAKQSLTGTFPGQGTSSPAPEPDPAPATQDDMLTQLRDMGLNVTDARTGTDAGTSTPPSDPAPAGVATATPGLIANAVAPADPIRSTGYPKAPRDPAPASLVPTNVPGKTIIGTDVNVTDATSKTLKDEVQGSITGTAEATPATTINVYDPTKSTLVTPATQTTPSAGVTDGQVTMATPTLPANFGSLSKDQKATLYASMRQQGFTDADIRAAAGTQDEASWQALRRLAGYDVPTVATVKPGSTARVKNNNFGGLLATANDPLAAANMAALAGSQAPGIIGSARTNPFAPPPTTVKLPPGVTPWWPGTGG